MAAGSVPANDSRGQQRLQLTEWFGLRRHPLPDFFNSLEGLPRGLAALAEGSLPRGRAVQGVLSLPQEYYARRFFGWEYVPERALVFLDDVALYLQAEGPGSPAQALLVDVRSLLYVRSSLLLLYGLLEMKVDCGSQPREVRLEYNTVIWNALRGPLGRLIAAASPCPEGDKEAARAANAGILKILTFKFANGLRYYVLEPGEHLCAAVFQPAIWERRGVFPSQVTPNTLFALTDGKVAVIEEQRSSAWRRQPAHGEYGWIFTYIPRDRVVDMVVTPRERWTELTVDLAWGSARDTRSFLLQPAIAAQWERSWSAAEIS